MIGREREFALLTERLVPGETIALVGPSGVGKTAVAEQVARAFDGAALVIDCFGLNATTAGEAAARAAGLELEASATSDLWVRAAEGLDGTGLVVLDDVSFDFEMLGPFRHAFSGAILVTCHVAPDDVTKLPIMGLPVGELGDFASSDGFALFLHAARRQNLNFEVRTDEIESVHAIACRLDGHPLGLCLAGRRAASTSVATVLDLLDDKETLSDPTRPARHQSLHATLQFSWDSLAHADQRRMYLMALFSRPLPPRTLAELGGEPLQKCLDGVHSLVGRGLVSHGRFPRPLESFVNLAISAYEAADPDDARSIVRAISQRALQEAQRQPRGLAEHADISGDEPSLWHFTLSRDDHGLADDELAVVLGAWLRWATLRSITFERLALPAHVLALLERFDDWNAWFMVTRHRLSEPVEALEAIERSLLAATTAEERLQSLLMRGYILVQLGRSDEALAEVEKARALGEFPAIGHAFVVEMLLMTGDEEGARATLDQLSGVSFGPVSAAYVQTLRAWLAPTSVDALREQEKAVNLCVQAGQLRAEAAARQSLAMLLAYRFGRYDDALHELERMRLITEKSGDYRFANRARASAVTVLVLQEDYEQASTIVEEIVGTGDPAIDDYCYLLWLIARWQLGDHELVRREWAKKELAEPPAAVPSQDVAWAVFDVGVALSHDLAHAEALATQHRAAMPEVASLLDAMLALAKLTPAADFKAVLKSWNLVREVRQQRDGSLGVELCWRLIDASLEDEMRGFMALEEMEGGVRILASYQAVIADDAWYDLSNQPVSQRLLQVLVEADRPLDHDAVGAALYPDEIVVEDAMKNRIDVQVSKLRKLGLRPYLAKRPDGFVLEGDVVVATAGSR